MPTSEKITFPGSRGASLAARLELPDGRPVAAALFAHCFTCSKDSHAAARVSRALARRGVAVLRFDFTGLGGSGGDFASTDFTSNVDDLLAAVEALRARTLAPQLLIGHSLGGAAVLAAAARVPEATAVATIAAPADPAHVLGQLGPDLARIAADGEGEVAIAGRAFRIRRSFVEDIGAHRLADAVTGLRKALLVLHAPRDAVVGIDNATRIFVAARHPKSFVSLDDADHLLTREADADYVAGVLAAWASRYVGVAARPADAPARLEPLAPGVVEVAETRAGTFTERVRVGRHVLPADEPEGAGGTDTGPGPYDYVLAGLGACTAMTLRLYADRKAWPLERVAVRLRHSRIHAEDCADCETKVGLVDHIERAITVEGPLDAAQRARLQEIADKCPVHRTLTSEIKIGTTLV
jgi:putative redox protein